ncbi:Spore protein SP21 [Polystyrenella longa]|uniref:Spore protein SP21 n=1 Tax=Polystyrenella longa TaxID=2528007 RepID=A0A518CUD5_9PLAN|nr:Hsp20/alpha crystallin family protein [Polystyrenella longa]QDU82841.1 Spore protein SP21 [Polystyrenella longa]
MSTNTETQNCESKEPASQEQQSIQSNENTLVYSPDVDIAETETGIDLTFDMPGVDQDHLDISIDKDVLTVVGHAEVDQEEGYESLYREFGAGDYRRAFRLPEYVDSQNVDATVKQGILTIHLPKAKRQTVTVKAV